jgi:uncharacterized membrane protein YciS (DUF1049 family)
MRVLCLVILLVVGAAVILFAMENQQPVTLTFYNYSLTVQVAALVGAAYALGMVSGWTVVGVLRRSFVRVTQFPERQQKAAY